MHKPIVPQQYFAEMQPLPYTSSVCMGEPIKSSQRGKVQVNTNEVASLVMNKEQLLRTLEGKKLPVCKPYHKADTFVKPYQGPQLRNALDYTQYTNTFEEQTVIARSPKGSTIISSVGEALQFFSVNEDNLGEYTLIGVDMTNYNTAIISVCPLFGTQKVRLSKELVIEGGIMHADFSGPVPTFEKEMFKLALKVTQEIRADYATVEIIYDEEGALVSNVSLAPCETLTPAIIQRMIAEKHLQTSHNRRKK